MKLTIDGKEVFVESGRSVLEAARASGIYVPTLCYHENLDAFGSCRLCIVEIEGMRGYPASCVTPATQGMVVKTNTEKIQALRRDVFELILTEHPNACLICSERKNCTECHMATRKVGVTTGCHFCPKDNRCDLQEVSKHIGLDEVTLPFTFKNLSIERNDPFFDRDYNLCILCGRCVRACSRKVIQFGNRGSETRITTAAGLSHLESNCQFCGQCVDSCPTGSLIERKSRWTPMVEKEAETICPLCSLGCAITAGVNGSRVIETVPKTIGCIRGRFCITELLDSPRRLLNPMKRQNNQWHRISWDEALRIVAACCAQYQGKDAAVICSASLTNEDLFVARKFAREVLNTSKIACPISGFKEDFWRECNEEGVKSLKLENIDQLGQPRFFYLVGADLTEDLNAKPSFVIVQDMFMPERASQFADLILPAAGLLEITGSIFNGRGLLRRLTATTQPLGQARADWQIICSLAKAMGAANFNYNGVQDIEEEMTAVSTSFDGTKHINGAASILELGPELAQMRYRSAYLSCEIKGIQRICSERFHAL